MRIGIDIDDVARERKNARAREWYARNQPRVREQRRVRNNREDVQAKARAYYHANKDRINAQQRRGHLIKKYGITPEQFNERLEAQGGKCPLCFTTEPGAKGWHVDHDHATGQYRGILCGRCNMSLGLWHDDVDMLARAIAYLRTEH